MGDQVVYVERSAAGEGLTVIVRAGVHGSVADRFVPLSGQPPYQEAPTSPPDLCLDSRTVCLDTTPGLSGHGTPEMALSGQEPYQENGTCLDTGRTLFSSSLTEENNYCGGESKPIQGQLIELAKNVSQGGASAEWKWVYSLISLLRANRLKQEDVTPHLLHDLSELVGLDPDEVHLKVLVYWKKWKSHLILLSDAYNAVQADPSLLDGLADKIVNPKALVVAGMARFMGGGGQAFVLDQRGLAQVFGLTNQQTASDLLHSLQNTSYLKKVAPGSYTKKKSAVYKWIGPGASQEELAVVTSAPTAEPTATSVQRNHPTPPTAAAPPPRRGQRARPGHSPVRDDQHRWPSALFQGGFLTAEHYLGEMMVKRELLKDGRTLPHEFWNDPKLGPAYARQVKAASAVSGG